MSHKNTYEEILFRSDEYLQEIADELRNKRPQKYALNQLQDSLFNEVKGQKKAELTKRKYRVIYGLLEILDETPQREILYTLLDQIYRMTETSYDPDLHFEHIRSYEKIGKSFDQNLITSLISKLGHHVKKEVKFLQMKDTDYLNNEVCEFAIGSIQNLTASHDKPSKQQTYEIVLLYEIFNYRLSTLNDEQVWDFMAQSIMEESKPT
jgi:hypothetical protein